MCSLQTTESRNNAVNLTPLKKNAGELSSSPPQILSLSFQLLRCVGLGSFFAHGQREFLSTEPHFAQRLGSITVVLHDRCVARWRRSKINDVCRNLRHNIFPLQDAHFNVRSRAIPLHFVFAGGQFCAIYVDGLLYLQRSLVGRKCTRCQQQSQPQEKTL